MSSPKAKEHRASPITPKSMKASPQSIFDGLLNDSLEDTDVTVGARVSRHQKKRKLSPRPISHVLSKAIDKLDANSFRSLIKDIDVALLRNVVKKSCETDKKMRRKLEKENLVLGKDVVRYHHGAESENDEESELESELESIDIEFTDDDSDASEAEEKKKVNPIAIKDDEYTPRYETCLRCKEEFDVTDHKRECHWHPGKISWM